MKYLRYPLGHPKVYQGADCPPIRDIFGLILCKILPPDNLYMPILPATINNKLVFTLCAKCAADQLDADCTHSDEERSITGTFTSIEVIAALRYGYKILDLYECWHYEQTSKFGDDEEGLWSKYINSMLKCKQEASGWPREDMTEDEKQKYIADYMQNEKIQLEYDKIEKNECRRQIHKLLLNSLWGKFGQNPHMSKTCIIQEPEELVRILGAPNVKVKSVVDTLGSKIMINYIDHEDSEYESPLTNVVVAAITTSHARVMLYQLLDILGERVLYMDTDSVIYYEPRGQPILKTGDYLGELTDEVAGYGRGAEIERYVSIGPKSYCLDIKIPGKENAAVRKLKGVTLKYNNKGQTDFNTMKKLVDGDLDDVTIKLVNQIERSEDFRIFTRASASKKVQLVYTKRAREGAYDTKPWGLRQNSPPVVADLSYEIEDWNVRNYLSV
jgi:hypothetical protein